LQVQSHTAAAQKYSGMADCAIQVYRSGGIASLYKGTMLTLMRDIPGSIAWFGTYEVVKRELVKLQGIEDPSKLSPIAIMVAGGFAGMACWYVSEKSIWMNYNPHSIVLMGSLLCVAIIKGCLHSS
jgi:solute carrier family 25 carnitine/acylcarnitine transporter 20/29